MAEMIGRVGRGVGVGSLAGLILVWCVVLGAVAARADNGPGDWSTGDQVIVQIGLARVRAVVVADRASRNRGLSGVKSLAPGAGMLFVFPEPDRLVFWMKGMLISIDMIFIRSGKVVHVAPRVPPPALAGKVVVVQCPDPADMVVEVAAGFCARFGVEKGTPVEITGSGPGGR